MQVSDKMESGVGKKITIKLGHLTLIKILNKCVIEWKRNTRLNFKGHNSLRTLKDTLPYHSSIGDISFLLLCARIPFVLFYCNLISIY